MDGIVVGAETLLPKSSDISGRGEGGGGSAGEGRGGVGVGTGWSR